MEATLEDSVSDVIADHLERAGHHLARAQEMMERELESPADEFDMLRTLKSWKTLSMAHEDLDKTRKAFHMNLELISRQTIPLIFASKGVKTVSLDDIGYRFTVSQRMSVSMPDKEGGKQWLRDNGLEGLIIETVNAATLSSTAKDLLEKGIMLPDEHFKTSVMNYTSATKIAKKKSKTVELVE